MNLRGDLNQLIPLLVMILLFYNTAKNLGALGGKLLGAGSSGYLLIYSSPLYQKRIKEALAEKDVTQKSFKFAQNGLEVWSTEK